jgi:endonuclease/exonuclease/phosphatase family metal-dependent hydrolase
MVVDWLAVRGCGATGRKRGTGSPNFINFLNFFPAPGNSRVASMRSAGESPPVTMRRPPALLVGFAAIAVLASCGRKQDNGIPRAVPIAENGALDLRLMTFNVRYEHDGDRGSRSWNERITGAVRMIRDENPDIVGIQEGLHGQVADLWVSLQDYEHLGDGRDDGMRRGEYSGIFFLRHRFLPDAGERGTFWLSDTPEVPGSMSWGNKIPRIVTWGKFVDIASNRPFYVFNTHWDHQSQESRERAAVLVANRIDARRDLSAPVVLMGDFNARENNPSVSYLTGSRVALAGETRQWENPLFETFTAANPGERNRATIHFWRDNIPQDAKIDHILASPGAAVISATVRRHDQPPVSDHYPVTAHIVFPPLAGD